MSEYSILLKKAYPPGKTILSQPNLFEVLLEYNQPGERPICKLEGKYPTRGTSTI